MPETRTVIVNMKPISIPVSATSKQIKVLALSAGIEPSKWGCGEMELREYVGRSGARLLADTDVPNGDEFGLREVDPKRETGFKTLEGWDKELVKTYPIYIQESLKGNAPRYFRGEWSRKSGTIAPIGYMTPHQISGASCVALVKVHTLSGNIWYEIPEARWVTETGESNPYQEKDGGFYLTMEDAMSYVEAFRKYRAYRRDRFGNGLPPEMIGLSDEELRPIHEYIAHMKAKERAGWAPSAHGSDYVKPKSFTDTVSKKSVARIWNANANRVETIDEAWERVQNEVSAKTIAKPEPPLPIPTPLSEVYTYGVQARLERFLSFY